MFSFMCSVNSFTKPLFNENVTKELKETTINLFIGTSFEKNIKKKLEDIEKKYLESHYNHEKKELIHDKQRIVDDEKIYFIVTMKEYINYLMKVLKIGTPL